MNAVMVSIDPCRRQHRTYNCELVNAKQDNKDERKHALIQELNFLKKGSGSGKENLEDGITPRSKIVSMNPFLHHVQTTQVDCKHLLSFGLKIYKSNSELALPLDFPPLYETWPVLVTASLLLLFSLPAIA